jgi:hypothetical protein
MHAAPPVSVSVRGGWPWRLVRCALPSVAAGAFVAWIAQHGGYWGVAPAAGLAVAVLAFMIAALRVRDPVVGLQWDGQHWLADGQAGELDIAIELPRWLLLRHRAPRGGGTRWIPMRIARLDPATETLLRVALHARPPAAGRTPVQPPVA